MKNFAQKYPDLSIAINAYMDFIKESYRTSSAMGSIEELHLAMNVGRRFVKIVEIEKGTGKERRVHSFINLDDFTTSAKAGNRSFKAGDILMAATFWQPALNKARGNVMELDYKHSTWTGAGYL